MLVRLTLLPAHAEKDASAYHGYAKLKRNDKRAQELSRKILFPANQWQGQFPKDLKIGFHGSDFQWQAMKQMLKLPVGVTMSYAELAHAAKAPGAARAAGSVCAKNPLPFIVPCHRITAAQGKLGSYGFGTALKRQLLNWENQ